MKYSYSFEQIAAAERAEAEAGTSSLVLMERAGRALAERAEALMDERGLSDVLIVAGGGNNGGDGFTAAQVLFSRGREVAVLCLAEKFSPACAEMRARFRGEVLNRMPRRRYALILDCVLGTGLKSEPAGDAAALIGFINASGAYVLSCDLPSGLSENGIARSPAVTADETLTLGGMKNALLMADGADIAGKISVADIGLDLCGGAEVWESGDVKTLFPKRKSHTHKGSYGSACILAAAAERSGALFLAAGACLRSGAGYTSLVAAEPLFSQAAGLLPACILREFRAIDGELIASDCIAYGMGAGASERTYARVVELLTAYTGVLVLDGDALTVLARYGAEVLKEKSCRVIVTPHPKEFARLTGRSVGEVTENAVSLARDFAAEYGTVVVLKNNRTVISDGVRTAINTTGSPALAKGGSGDVLAGFLAGTCARGAEPFEAACAACYLLGRAGELAAAEMGEYAPDASDVIRYLPAAMRSVSP